MQQTTLMLAVPAAAQVGDITITTKPQVHHCVVAIINDPAAPGHMPFGPIPRSEMYVYSQIDCYDTTYSVYLASVLISSNVFHSSR